MEYVEARHIIHRNKSTSWFGTDHTMNLYRGCCHGCIYCDSRSACYQIEDFDRVRAKRDALKLLRDDLQRKAQPAFIAMGGMSDTYNPFEAELQLTRHALELIDAFQCGAAIATKSDLITRDIDVLSMMKTHSPVLCKVTVTTTDDALAARVEPNAPSPSRRLAAIRKLSDAGIFTGVLLMPVLPFLEDSEQQVLSVVRAAAAAGARFVYPAFGMTLRQNQRDWYYTELERRFPGKGLKERYQKTFGTRYECYSPNVRSLWRAFSAECDRLGLLYGMKHIISAVTRGYGDRQLTFFD